MSEDDPEKQGIGGSASVAPEKEHAVFWKYDPPDRGGIPHVVVYNTAELPQVTTPMEHKGVTIGTAAQWLLLLKQRPQRPLTAVLLAAACK